MESGSPQASASTASPEQPLRAALAVSSGRSSPRSVAVTAALPTASSHKLDGADREEEVPEVVEEDGEGAGAGAQLDDAAPLEAAGGAALEGGEEVEPHQGPVPHHLAHLKALSSSGRQIRGTAFESP